MFDRAAREKFERVQEARLPSNADGVVIGAEAIHRVQNSGRAALVIHGFNDTPQSMSYLAQKLFDAGWTVSVPRLPGHGVTLPRMASESRAAAWFAAVNDAYSTLRATHKSVVVCGQSMGGALAVLLAVQHKEIPALALLAPYLGMSKLLQFETAIAWAMRPFSLYHASRGSDQSLHDPVAKAAALSAGVITARTLTELRSIAQRADAALPRLTVPTLYLQSRQDNRINVRDAERDFAAIATNDKSQRWLTGCGHIISADFCRDEVADQVIQWFESHPATR